MGMKAPISRISSFGMHRLSAPPGLQIVNNLGARSVRSSRRAPARAFASTKGGMPGDRQRKAIVRGLEASLCTKRQRHEIDTMAEAQPGHDG